MWIVEFVVQLNEISVGSIDCKQALKITLHQLSEWHNVFVS